MDNQINWYDPTHSNTVTPMTWMNNLNAHCRTQDHAHCGGTTTQFGTDDPKYVDNIAPHMPADWLWHDRNINYTFNTDGFRSDQEFNFTDWPNTWVILGDSQVFGLGVTVDHTVSAYISEQLHKPVINLGVVASSCDVLYNNMVTLIHRHGPPAGVVIQWPMPVRRIEELRYHPPEWRRSDIGAWNMQPQHMQDMSPFYRRSLMQHSTAIMLADCPLVEIDYADVKTSYPSDIAHEFEGKDPQTVWQGLSESARTWYVNEYLAKDQLTYDHTAGPQGGHQGPAQHLAMAQHCVEVIKKGPIR